MARKLSKRNRNALSGVLVGIASIFAVINFADLPAGEVKRFLVSTAVFFLGIVLLALAAVTLFKCLGWLGKKLLGDEAAPGEEPDQLPGAADADASDRDRE